MVKVEKVVIDKFLLSKIINNDFLKEFGKTYEDIIPVMLVLRSDKYKSFLNIVHENSEEVKDNIVHVSSENQDFINKTTEIIKKFKI